MKKDGTVSYRGAVYPRWPRLICSARIESGKIDDVTFILDDPDCVPGCRFHSRTLCRYFRQIVMREHFTPVDHVAYSFLVYDVPKEMLPQEARDFKIQKELPPRKPSSYPNRF